jgi:hypothetical protein
VCLTELKKWEIPRNIGISRPKTTLSFYIILAHLATGKPLFLENNPYILAKTLMVFSRFSRVSAQNSEVRRKILCKIPKNPRKSAFSAKLQHFISTSPQKCGREQDLTRKKAIECSPEAVYQSVFGIAKLV